MKSFVLFSFSVVVASAAVAQAHGPQIQITRDITSGRIVTRQIVDTHAGQSSLSSPTSVYVMPLLPTAGVYQARPNQSINGVTGFYNYGGPGISYQYDTASGATPDGNALTVPPSGGNLAGTGWAHSNSTLLPNLKGTTFSVNLLSGLEYWNGTAFVGAGTEQLQVGSTITTDLSPFGQLNVTTVGANYGANPHAGLNHTLLGDGTSSTAASDDGIYRLQLQLASTAGDVLASDPFYFVLSKNAAGVDLDNAINSLGVSPSAIQNVVPEPASLAILGLASLLGLRRRRQV